MGNMWMFSKQLSSLERVKDGPNDCWHIDGYDKLKPFGFPIHGCIDGYSRKILWLELLPSNNDPNVLASFIYSALRVLAKCQIDYEQIVLQKTA